VVVSPKQLNNNSKQLKKMKNLILSLSLIAAIGFTSCKNETKTTEIAQNTEVTANVSLTDLTFGVRGNCGMCKSTIEKAANSVDGVASADWNRDEKRINVSFDDTKTKSKDIQNAIAASGYDTEDVMGDLEAYENLPGCCKYDHTMKMNQTSEGENDKHEH